MSAQPYAEIVASSARRWEAMAQHRPGMSLDQHRAGVSALDPDELNLLGDLQGARVLHLACSVCDQGITMATRGAQVVGVDIAETHVRAGRAKAAAIGVEVEIRVGDMMRLDDDLREFDLVYIGGGGICWVPDLDDWLVQVRRALIPGGRILISEHHPIWETLGVAGDRQLNLLHDYFAQRDLSPLDDSAKSAIGKAETSEHEDKLRSFLWGIGAVASSLLRHDFRIVALTELPEAPMYRGLGEAADCLPAVYRMMATRS
jgi:SAM-dependent methyltransferase